MCVCVAIERNSGSCVKMMPQSKSTGWESYPAFQVIHMINAWCNYFRPQWLVHFTWVTCEKVEAA